MYRFIISMVVVLVLFSVSFVSGGNAAGILNVGNPPSAEEQEKLAKEMNLYVDRSEAEGMPVVSEPLSAEAIEKLNKEMNLGVDKRQVSEKDGITIWDENQDEVKDVLEMIRQSMYNQITGNNLMESTENEKTSIEDVKISIEIENRLTVLRQDIETCVNIKRIDQYLDTESTYCRKLAKEYLQLMEIRDEIEQQ